MGMSIYIVGDYLTHLPRTGITVWLGFSIEMVINYS